MLIVVNSMTGYAIEATDGRLGTLSDLLFDDQTWRGRWLVVDTGNWLDRKRVLIHPSAFNSVDHDARILYVDLTRDQVQASPPISDHLPITRETERSQFDYYSWDPYWGTQSVGIVPGGGPIVEDARLQDGPDPNLRSAEDINNYHIVARDGNIGHLDTMLVDDTSFQIDSLILNTSDWWSGQTVLVSTGKVTSFNAHDRLIRIAMTRAQIKTSPNWDPSRIVAAEIAAGQTDHQVWPGNRSR